MRYLAELHRTVRSRPHAARDHRAGGAGKTHAVMGDEAVRRSLLASGFEPDPDSTPEKTHRFVVDEIARWTPIIKAFGLKLD